MVAQIYTMFLMVACRTAQVQAQSANRSTSFFASTFSRVWWRQGQRFCLVLLAVTGWVVPARAADETECAAAIASAERHVHLPPRLMTALALVESGRLVGRRVVPWPWAINAGGVGRYFESKADAMAAVAALQSEGVQSIDVGCMQINLLMHPRAFNSLEQAFDPETNAAYGAQFLSALFMASRSWGHAITAYHSSTPEFAADYARRVLAVWPEAATYGLTDSNIAAPTSKIDPQRVYTVAFAQLVIQDIADRERRNLKLRIVPARSLLQATTDQRHGPAWPQSSHHRGADAAPPRLASASRGRYGSEWSDPDAWSTTVR